MTATTESTAEIEGRQIQIDGHKRVTGFIPSTGGIHFEFWSGAVRSTIRLSDAAFHAAATIYADLQRDKIKEEGGAK